jgi:hypothetical protein
MQPSVFYYTLIAIALIVQVAVTDFNKSTTVET